MQSFRCLFVIGVFLFSGAALNAEPLTLPSILSDHMVLQRGMPAPIWGHADAGAEVRVNIAGQAFRTTANPDGSWMVRVGPFDAKAESTEITVASGDTTLTIHDVLIGDTWIAAGQSNMELALRQSTNAAEFIAGATDASIRLFTVRRSSAIEPRLTANGRWVVCSPATAGMFSAVGYHFAREIRKHENVPVGMIGTYASGTRIEPWTSLDAYLHDPLLAEYATRIQESIDTLDARRKDYTEQVIPEWQTRHDQWEKEVGVTYRPALEAWNKQAAEDRAAGRSLSPKPKPGRPEPKRPDVPNLYSLRLSGLYNAMVAPLTPYGIKGILWYQGESNADDPKRYRALFAAMINDWRKQFQQTDLPFLFVQLPNFVSYPDADWPGLREAQAAALDSVPNTAMAVSIDVGSDQNLHPPRKYDIGYRLSLAARALAYGEKVEFKSPMLDSVKIDGNTAVVKLKNVGEGLHAGAPSTMPADAQPIEIAAFALAGADGQFQKASAKLVNRDTVAVTSPRVPQPVYVRYAWANTPHVNLYSSSGLPAAPFRTDDLPLSPPATQPGE